MKYIKLLLFLLIVFSCNPVKKVLNDPKKFEKVAQEVIKRGYCINDTTIVINTTDTIIITQEEEFNDTMLIENGFCNFDTTLKSGLHIKFENGHLYVKEKRVTKTNIVTKNSTKYIRDIALENILKKDITASQDSIKFLQGSVLSYKETNKELTKKLTTVKIYFILFVLLIVISTLYKIVKKFTNPIL